MTVTIFAIQSRLVSRRPDHLSAGQVAGLGAAGVTGAPTVRTSTLFAVVPMADNPLVAGLPTPGPEGLGRGHRLAVPRPAATVASR